MKVNFIIGGSAAAGTSYLYELLIQHPEIYLPQSRIPEPHYYYKSWEYAKGLQWYLQTYFGNVPRTKIAIGERSSSYLYGGEKVASRIAKDFPKMKFIFMLRNPIQRAFANYRFTVLQGLETLSFKDALLQEKVRIKAQTGIWSEISPYDYTGRGFYDKQLKDFFQFFPRNQILCLCSEDVQLDNFEELKKIYNFLELNDRDFKPKEASTYTSLSVINPILQAEFREHFKDEFSSLMQGIRGKEDIDVKHQMLFNNLKPTKESIPLECQEILLDLYRDSIERLQEVVSFDTSRWINSVTHHSAGGGALLDDLDEALALYLNCFCFKDSHLVVSYAS